MQDSIRPSDLIKKTRVRILVADDNKQIHKDFMTTLGSDHAVEEENKELDDLIKDILDEGSSIESDAYTNCPYEFDLDFALQGEEAAKMVDQAYYEEQPYSVVFMDVRMPPGWTGIETIKRIWQKHPDIEMVICTAYSDYTWEDFSNILGVSHRLLLLKKPFDKMEVKQLALSLSMKSNYYKKYQHHVEELEQAVASRTKDLEAEKIKAEVANRAKSSFLANMSHELRTPLNGILGYADIMARSDDLSELQTNNLHVIQRCGTYLLSLINNVLDLSKIESGLMEKHEVHFNLYQLIDDVQQMLLPRCQRYHLRLDINVATNVPKIVHGDDQKLRQILINLMGNAVKFTPANGQVSLNVSSLDNNQVTFSVEDTGSGIPESDLETIFQPFQQSTIGTHDDGTGLGLSICTNFVQLLGGELRVSSQLNQGSCFFFTISLPEVASTALEQELLQQVVAIDLGENTEKVWSVLVVDNNDISLNLCRQLLEKVGFSVISSDSCQQSMALLGDASQANLPIDLVICDAKMPCIEGDILSKTIKLAWPDLPIIISSTSRLIATEKENILNGADAFIEKPLNSEKLFQLIARLIKVTYHYKTMVNEDYTPVHDMKLVHGQLASLEHYEHQQLVQLLDDGNLKEIRQKAQSLKEQNAFKHLGNFICEMAIKYDTDALQKLFNRDV